MIKRAFLSDNADDISKKLDELDNKMENLLHLNIND